MERPYLAVKHFIIASLTGPTTDSQVECKAIKEIMNITIEKTDVFDNLYEKHKLYNFFLRITAWIKRFLNNCQKTKCSGPLKTDEIEHQKKLWIKREQRSHPVFIPPDSLLAEKLICQVHKNTFHGGVVLTMTKS